MFQDVLSRWEAKSLSALEAAEILGMSERTFRRYRRRHEVDGLEGLYDHRLGRASARAVPVDKIEWMIEEYRTHHRGWTVKHFHDHLFRHHGFAWGYTWTKTRLQQAGLVAKAPKRGAPRRRRPRKPRVGMMLHQDGSRHGWLAGQAPRTQVGRVLHQLRVEHIAAYSPEARGRSEQAFGTLSCEA